MISYENQYSISGNLGNITFTFRIECAMRTGIQVQPLLAPIIKEPVCITPGNPGDQGNHTLTFRIECAMRAGIQL